MHQVEATILSKMGLTNESIEKAGNTIAFLIISYSICFCHIDPACPVRTRPKSTEERHCTVNSRSFCICKAL